MSQAPNGNYFLVNKATTSNKGLLAVTYNGDGKALTVTEFNYLDTQVVRSIV